MADALPFFQLSHYRILARLGAGGMGEVYLAEDTRLERRVAIKVLPAAFTTDADRVRRFLLEARASSALNHPNIITIHDIGESDAGRFLVMEAVAGRTVREMLGEGIALDALPRLGGQMARGLAAAHAAGIVHRDIKPENIMVRDDGYVKILDFGLARLAPAGVDGPDSTEPGVFMGTLKYMSPEQARGEVAAAASDIYSLGMVFFEMATGRHPFPTKSFVGMLNAIVSDPVGAPGLLNPALPVEWDELICRMLHKDAGRRPTAEEVAAALEVSRAGELSTSAYPAAAVPVVAAAPANTVGRARELGEMWAALGVVATGRGGMLSVCGEPGIGKSTLVEAFLAEVAATGGCTVARGRCSERLAGTEAYLPLLGALDNLLQTGGLAGAGRILRELAPAWFAQISSAGSFEGAAAVSLERLKRELVQFLGELGRAKPVLLLIDDLHWADVSTVDLLVYLASQFNGLRLFVVVTYRPSDMILASHPFLAVKPDLVARGALREVALGFLTEAEVAEYLNLEFPGHRFPAGLPRLIHQKTEGSPLFMADLVRFLRDSDVISRDSGTFLLARVLPEVENVLPESVRGMIERKIAQLTVEDRQLLTAASVQGFEFDSAVLIGVLGLAADRVEERLDELERVYSFVKLVREAEFPSRVLTLRYRFVHVLYQNALYQSVRATRRATLSREVATALEGHWGARAGQAANELALLWEAAREYGKAAHYFGLAARQAGKVFADAEAVVLARRGLAALEQVGESQERTDQELVLLVILGVALRAVEGFSAPGVGEAYGRARELCPAVGTSPRLVPVLRGLWEYYEVRGDYGVALPYARQLLELSMAIGDPGLVVVGCDVMGDTSVWMGDFGTAWEHLSRGIALYDAEAHRSHLFVYGYDTGMACYSYGAMALYHLGYPGDAAAHMRKSSEIAARLQHPMTTAFAGIMEAWLYRLMGDFGAAAKGAERAIATSIEHGLPFFLGFGRMTLGWTWVGMGRAEEGVAEILAGLEVYRGTGSELGNSLWLGCLAEGYLAAGRRAEARATWEQAVAFMEERGEGVYRVGLARLGQAW